MTTEELILSELKSLKAGQESMQKQISGINARLDSMDARFDSMDARLTRVEDDVRWTRIEIENRINPTIQLLLEHQQLLSETCAKKENLDELREDLSLQKFRLDVVAEHIGR
ncbi:MAG: hypothetical protein IJU29_03535 [Oscillospiraceae bacterium]|nr:hypothetical protein [Oscillospiraceae bacterium]